MMILKELRKDARQSLTNISSATKIPITTVYDRIKAHEKNLIRKNVCLIDFAAIGFNGRAHIVIKAEKESRVELKNFLLEHRNVNSLYIINHGFDFMIEAVFRSMREIVEFVEEINNNFAVNSMCVYHIVDELQKEAFLTK